MRSSGIIRRVDELGRIVIPKEMRSKLGIDPDTPMEIHLDGDTIVLQKDATACIFCGRENADVVFHGKAMCASCREELKA